ncbi:TetR/AcrR family transcriptional regulator [Nocardia mexicana]|uniref:TetR family transcriptional regulator n=1 Tax=Nocardia mexicana TaxID=279262 RepID=A0A370GVW0_9NOCA|nr:TetR/AcrR family transcriptional regulator [Nocardia mexicana]RDI46724.1 TetR family transcriptional regulator [Nocardia mexicana]
MPTKTAAHHRHPTQERAKATRQHILDTAAKLFGQRGIANTSTNRIAAEAGVSIGTVYRHFADRTAIADDLLAGLIGTVEWCFTQRLLHMSGETTEELIADILHTLTDELVAHAPLVRALVATVQFPTSGLPELEPRLHTLTTALLTRILGPANHNDYDTMAFVLVNTGFAAVLRTGVIETGSTERHEILDMTARMIAAWIEAEHKPGATQG